MHSEPDSALPVWSRRLLAEFDAADRRAESVARGLTPEQLNWHPAQGAWSVAQCLEHLRVSSDVYLPAIGSSLERRPQGAAGEIRLGWFTRWFIRNFIAPGGPKARAPGKARPPSQVPATILEAFLASNQNARDMVRRASGYDVNRIRFKNPFLSLLRFTVGAGLQILATHQARHLLQAEGVRNSAGFPR